MLSIVYTYFETSYAIEDHTWETIFIKERSIFHKGAICKFNIPSTNSTSKLSLHFKNSQIQRLKIRRLKNPKIWKFQCSRGHKFEYKTVAINCISSFQFLPSPLKKHVWNQRLHPIVINNEHTRLTEINKEPMKRLTHGALSLALHGNRTCFFFSLSLSLSTTSPRVKIVGGRVHAIRRRHSTVLGRLQTRTWQKKRVNNVEAEPCVVRKPRQSVVAKTMETNPKKNYA